RRRGLGQIHAWKLHRNNGRPVRCGPRTAPDTPDRLLGGRRRAPTPAILHERSDPVGRLLPHRRARPVEREGGWWDQRHAGPRDDDGQWRAPAHPRPRLKWRGGRVTGEETAGKAGAAPDVAVRDAEPGRGSGSPPPTQ